jgi:hypothetical protein
MKITLPKSWDDISIRQFTELTRVKELNLDPIEQMANLISILSGESFEVISRLTLDSLKKAYSCVSFIDTIEFSGKVIPKITIDGVEYIASLDIRKITAGRYIDLKEFTKDPSETPYNIHNIMAVLYLPKGKKYKGKTHEKRASLFYEKMPITFAYPVAVFFWNLLNNSMPDIRDSFEKDVITKIKKVSQEI